MMIDLKKILPFGFLIFVLATCILLFTSELVNHRFWLNDFKVYYLSAKAMLEGQQIYGIPHGLDSGFYKYSPFVLLFYIPLTLLPYKAACIIYYFGIVIAILLVFSLIRYFFVKFISHEPVKYQGWILSVAFVFALNLLYRELHLGNTNIFLLLLILLMAKLVTESRYFIAGILLGLILLFKPFFLILAIPIILHKKQRIIIGAASLFVLQAAVIIILFGWKLFYFLHAEWIKTMFSHSSSFPSGNNIEYLVRNFITANLPSNFGYFLLLAVMLFLIIFFFYKNYAKNKTVNKSEDNKNFLLECFISIAIIPSILNTDTEHFLYTLPLILLIIFDVFIRKKTLLFICLFLLFLLYGTNSNDIVGKIIGDFYNRIGAVGISNLLLFIWGCYLYFGNIKTPSTEAKGVSAI
jgi:hypothetical protein